MWRMAAWQCVGQHHSKLGRRKAGLPALFRTLCLVGRAVQNVITCHTRTHSTLSHAISHIRLNLALRDYADCHTPVLIANIDQRHRRGHRVLRVSDPPLWRILWGARPFWADAQNYYSVTCACGSRCTRQGRQAGRCALCGPHRHWAQRKRAPGSTARVMVDNTSPLQDQMMMFAGR